MNKEYYVMKEDVSDKLELDIERIYTKEEIIEAMREVNADKVQIFKAVHDNSSEFFYCQKDSEVYEKIDSYDWHRTCGIGCDNYIPRNGKSGCCKHNRSLYGFGDEYTLYSDGRLEEVTKQKEKPIFFTRSKNIERN